MLWRRVSGKCFGTERKKRENIDQKKKKKKKKRKRKKQKKKKGKKNTVLRQNMFSPIFSCFCYFPVCNSLLPLTTAFCFVHHFTTANFFLKTRFFCPTEDCSIFHPFHLWSPFNHLSRWKHFRHFLLIVSIISGAVIAYI